MVLWISAYWIITYMTFLFSNVLYSVSGWHWVILQPACRHVNPHITHITSCKNVIGISLLFLLLFRKFCRVKKERILCGSVNNMQLYCIYNSEFSAQIFFSFQNPLILEFIFKLFLKFCKFQPRYSYKYIVIKRKSVLNVTKHCYVIGL